MDMDMVVFAERLKTTRKRQNISAKELADAVGINKSTIHRYETGDFQSIKKSVLEKIADYLNVNPDYLIGATDNKHTVKEAEDLLNSITDAEKSLLELFRRVPEEHRQMVLEMIKIALKQSQ
jgi:transcriptional regulator with XRE-family HTH domain